MGGQWWTARCFILFPFFIFLCSIWPTCRKAFYFRINLTRLQPKQVSLHLNVVFLLCLYVFSDTSQLLIFPACAMFFFPHVSYSLYYLLKFFEGILLQSFIETLCCLCSCQLTVWHAAWMLHHWIWTFCFFFFFSVAVVVVVDLTLLYHGIKCIITFKGKCSTKFFTSFMERQSIESDILRPWPLTVRASPYSCQQCKVWNKIKKVLMVFSARRWLFNIFNQLVYCENTI